MEKSATVDFRRCPECGAELEIVCADELFALNYLQNVQLDDAGRLEAAEWGTTDPDWDGAVTSHYLCGQCRVELPESYQQVLDEVMDTSRPASKQKIVVVYDAYVRIVAASKDEADRHLGRIEAAFELFDRASLSIFDAYGIEDPATGAELRPVG